MRRCRSGFLLSARTAFALLIALTFVSVAPAASTEKVVYSFSSVGGGMNPTGNLTPAGGQVFFGETQFGGTGTLCGGDGCGTVFELRRSGNVWTKTTIYSFKGGTDGQYPLGGLVLDGSGNLYGTAFEGGTYGLGRAFELTNSHGIWTETILHDFGSDDTDGAWPAAGVILDAAGNLYGTTSYGGASNGGTAFELVRSSAWKENILHAFGSGSDGSGVFAGLVMDSAGDLFGTTDEGGTGSSCFYGCGIVFELTPSGGSWTESVIHNFTGEPDGAGSESPLIFDSAGNLYGVTQGGGSGTQCGSCGTAFELVPGTNGSWTETVIYSFGSYQDDGWEPISALALDQTGNLYGATFQGGTGFCVGGCGTVFELAPSSNGWSESLLHSFLESGDGKLPAGGVVLDNAGNLYGTTGGGGSRDSGIVYVIKPWTAASPKPFPKL